MEKIHWSLTAQQDLQNLVAYIAQDSPFYAVNFIDRIIHHVDILEVFPEQGRIVPEFSNENIRELIFHNYRIVYKLDKTLLYIIAVVHCSMDIERRSKNKKWEIH